MLDDSTAIYVLVAWRTPIPSVATFLPACDTDALRNRRYRVRDFLCRLAQGNSVTVYVQDAGGNTLALRHD
jgi:hypothetical protein